jgi:hypothetical protein
MSKKKKLLSGLGVLVLAGGVSAVASVPSNAAESKRGTAHVAQATPDISVHQRIVGGAFYQSQIKSVDYFRAVAANGVHWSSLNVSKVTKDKLAGAVHGKLNKVAVKGVRGPAGAKSDTSSTDPAGSDDQNGDNSSVDPAGPDDQNGDNDSADPAGSDDQNGDDPAGPDDQNGDNDSADPAGSDDQNGDTGPAGPSEDGQHGDTGSSGSNSQ